MAASALFSIMVMIIYASLTKRQSHAYRAYNKRTMLIGESVHITFDEINQKVQDESKNTEEGYETERIQ